MVNSQRPILHQTHNNRALCADFTELDKRIMDNLAVFEISDKVYAIYLNLQYCENLMI